MNTRLRSLTVGLVAAGVIGTAAAPAAQADVIRIPNVHGRAAFAIGPYANPSSCQARANTLAHYGAKRYGPRFATCYRSTHNGKWWAISPWSA